MVKTALVLQKNFVTEMVQYFFKKNLKNLLTIRYEYDIIISSRRDKNQGGK